MTTQSAGIFLLGSLLHEIQVARATGLGVGPALRHVFWNALVVIIQGRAEENVQKSSVTLRITGTSRANVHTFWLYIGGGCFLHGDNAGTFYPV
jgi:hypothetical protein